MKKPAKQPPATGCVLYARVSSEEQAKKETIETQLFAAKQQCAREGITLREVYRDEGVSGTVPFDKRPGGQRLLADARAGKFATVLLYRVDRLGRADVVSHVAKAYLETLGVDLRSLTEPFETKTAAGKFMFSILVAASSMERESIKQRAKAGLHRVASEGRWANAKPPFGYRVVDRRLVPYEPEAEIVKTIFTLAVQRHSLLQIAKSLTARHILTQTGKPWRHAFVARVLRRSTYRGVYQWAGTVALTVPAIVTPKTWDAAQAAILLNVKSSRRHATHDYLLRSLVRCAFCDRHMSGATSGHGHRYYKCNGKADPHRRQRCPSRCPSATWLEEIVWNTLADWILRREDLEAALTKALAEQDAERQAHLRTPATLQQQLAHAESKRERVVTAFSAGLIRDTDLTRQLAVLDQEQQRLQSAVDELREMPLDTTAVLTSIRGQLQRYRKDGQRGTLPADKKRQIVDAFVEEVRVRMPIGSAGTAAVREILPFRAPVSEGGIKETLWQREHQPPADAPGVEVRYRFPLPDAIGFPKPGSGADRPQVQRRPSGDDRHLLCAFALSWGRPAAAAGPRGSGRRG
jgi:site-specific DNA recombinase